MKKIQDMPLQITIKNTVVNYDLKCDNLLNREYSTTRYRKNGFMLYDSNDRNIGIVFRADDERTARFGNAEILFFKQFQNEYGSWRVIKVSGKYLPYEKLASYLQAHGQLTITTDERSRTQDK